MFFVSQTPRVPGMDRTTSPPAADRVPHLLPDWSDGLPRHDGRRHVQTGHVHQGHQGQERTLASGQQWSRGDDALPRVLR